MDTGERFERLAEVMHTLRRECPWDRKQTHDTLRAYLLEETHEVLEILDERRYEELGEELGDLLLQVIFQAEVAQDEGWFDIDDVIDGITEKLIRRHPHVFADAEAETPDDVVRRWESIKTGIEKKESVLDGVPEALPALLKASRVLSKIRQTGLEPFDERSAVCEARTWLDRLIDAPTEDSTEAETAAGVLCLAVAALARRAGANPEDGLRKVLGRLIEAFQSEEKVLKRRGRAFDGLSPDERAAWEARLRDACEGEDQ
ncbi:MAG: nucleoside triphosphate pyrophosphohydrolase [Planctomycetota bacterium]